MCMSSPIPSQQAIDEQIDRLEAHLVHHRDRLFQKQHRDGEKKRKFSLTGSFKIGLGSTQPGNLQYVDKKPGFVRFGSTAAFVTPVSEQAGLTHEKREAYEMAMQLLQSIDPQYAAGETLVQFALMESHKQYVKLHRDEHDISYQYALSLGDYQGAALRVYKSNGSMHEFDNRRKIVRFDGRLPHEVVVEPSFRGRRYTVIWYKNYDSRMQKASPILDMPATVYAHSATKISPADSDEEHDTEKAAVDPSSNKRRATEPLQQRVGKRVRHPAAHLLYNPQAAVAPSEVPSAPPLPGPSSLPPALSAEEVAQGDSMEHGGDGGCTASAMVEIGVWSSKEAAVADLDAQIAPMHQELQRRWGRACDESEAGIHGEQWHEEAIKRAVVARGWHFHKVKIDATDAQAVDLKDTLKAGRFFTIGVTNNRWYKGAKKQQLKYPNYHANAPAVNSAGWIHSIAIVDGRVLDHHINEVLSSLWLRADNQPNPDKGYMRSIRKVWRVTKCCNPGTGCRGACIRL